MDQCFRKTSDTTQLEIGFNVIIWKTLSTLKQYMEVLMKKTVLQFLTRSPELSMSRGTLEGIGRDWQKKLCKDDVTSKISGSRAVL